MKPGDVVLVSFPHVEDNRLRPRPALIVAIGLGGAHDLCWGLMITSAENEAWPGNILIENCESVGLPIPSRIRTEKIATLMTASANYRGLLPDALWSEVRKRLAVTLDGEI